MVDSLSGILPDDRPSVHCRGPCSCVVLEQRSALGGAITVILKVPGQVTFTSIAAEDGWVRESNETSDIGGVAVAAGRCHPARTITGVGMTR